MTAPINSFKFNLLDLAARRGETTFELMRQLRKLQNDRVIILEINEEILCVQKNINLKQSSSSFILSQQPTMMNEYASSNISLVLEKSDVEDKVNEIYNKLR